MVWLILGRFSSKARWPAACNMRHRTYWCPSAPSTHSHVITQRRSHVFLMPRPTNKVMPKYANEYTSAASCLLPWTVIRPFLLLPHLQVVAHVPRSISKTGLRRVHQDGLKPSYLSPRGFRQPRRADMTVSNTAFTVFSGIGFIISLIPLSWHLEAQNVGTCLYLIWTALACLTYFINSIIWSGNTTNWAPVWCDISMFIHPLPHRSISILIPEEPTFFSCSHSNRCCCRMAR